MGSLARRLSGVIIAVLVPLELVVAGATYLGAEHRSSELVDRLLAQQADAMADVAALRDAQPAATPRLVGAKSSTSFQVWSGDNRLAASSPAFAKLALDGAPDGFSDLRLDGHRWRVLTSLTNGRWIRVGQRREVEDAALRATALQLGAFVLLGVPLMLAGLRLVLGRGLEPIGVLAEEIARSVPGRSGPIGPGELPCELEPVVASVNRLLARSGRG